MLVRTNVDLKENKSVTKSQHYLALKLSFGRFGHVSVQGANLANEQLKVPI
jgi:hypothetical protein